MLASDMIGFLSITAVTLTAFASAFNLVLDTRGLLLFGLRLRACFMMMLGDINFEDFTSTAAPLVFFFVVLHRLQLVNMLIAKMGDTYSRITEEAEHRFWLERARMCLAIEGEDHKGIVEDKSKRYWITEGKAPLQKRMVTIWDIDQKRWDREKIPPRQAGTNSHEKIALMQEVMERFEKDSSQVLRQIGEDSNKLVLQLVQLSKAAPAAAVDDGDGMSRLLANLDKALSNAADESLPLQSRENWAKHAARLQRTFDDGMQ
jgi:hypothetical protein